MLQFTFPLLGEDGQSIEGGGELKTIALFILNNQDFNTAVSYLSQNAGMRHCQLKNLLANLMHTDVPQHTQSQPQNSYGASALDSPMGLPMRPPMRPASQASVHAPAMYSPAQHVYRSQTARPNPTPFHANLVRRPPRPGTMVPVRGPIPPQDYRYRSSLPRGPRDPASFYAPDSSRQVQRLSSRSLGVGGIGERTPLYEHHVRRSSMTSQTLSPRPVQHTGWEPPSSHYQFKENNDELNGSHDHGYFDGQPADQGAQVAPSARRSISVRTPIFEEHPSSRPAPERLASRSPSVSERGFPIKIQVLGVPEGSSHSYSNPKVRWDFTLHLLPSTKMWELCLHAASYVHREYHSTIDGRALAAQSKNGTVFEDQVKLSENILQGETLFLVERRHSGKVEPIPVNLGGSSPDSRPEVGNQKESRPTYSEDSNCHPIDETDQVPPPRQLPFPLVATPLPTRSSSSTAAAQSPLNERPDLMNARDLARTGRRSKKSDSHDISTKEAPKKQSDSRQSRPQVDSRRPASSASISKPVSALETTQPSETRIVTSRPETSQGIRRKRKASSSLEESSAAIPRVIEPLPSRADVSKKELASTPCMGCRNKKRKCNRSKPACGPCLKDNRPCIYPNIQDTAATASTATQTSEEHVLETATHPMAIGSKALTSLPIMLDAVTQTSDPRATRDIGAQTQEAEQSGKDIHTKDVGTDPCSLYTDVSAETDRCDDIWLPFSQSAEVMMWAGNRYEEQIRKAAEIFSATDPSREDYHSKVAQAAVHAVEFHKEVREKCEQALKR